MDWTSLDPKSYVRLVPEEKCPVVKSYVRSVDGLYVACAIRKPVGDGPFPAIVVFDGAPGGWSMENLVKRVSGNAAMVLFERFLIEGYVVAAADYRMGWDIIDDIHPETVAHTDSSSSYFSPHNHLGYSMHHPWVDDAVSIIKYVKNLPYVDPLRVGAFGGSLGGATVLEAIGLVQVAAAAVGDPASMGLLGIQGPKNVPREKMREMLTEILTRKWREKGVDREKALSFINRISCPVLLIHGTADSFLDINLKMVDLMKEVGKNVEAAIFEGEGHGFYFGSPFDDAVSRPITKGTLMALERSVSFFNRYLKD